jgi:scyllo-inositol 2-dehydrogenase (NADP+)
LQHGCHVVLEKPMTTNAGEARELIALAQSKGLVLSVFHNRRWDSDFLTVRKLIASGRLGSIRYMESHFDRFRPVVRQRWRELPGKGTGIWFDLGSHLVDQVLVLFGLPESVTARCLALRDGSAATDYFHVQLHYDRLEVVLHASLFAAGENLRFRLEGDCGTYVKTGLDVQEEQLKSGMPPSHSQFGLEDSARSGVLSTANGVERIPSGQGCYRTYYDGIVEAIIGLKEGKAPPVRAAEAMQVMRILELAESSSREGKTLRIRQDDH